MIEHYVTRALGCHRKDLPRRLQEIRMAAVSFGIDRHALQAWALAMAEEDPDNARRWRSVADAVRPPRDVR
jgi:hypothetical protein